MGFYGGTKVQVFTATFPLVDDSTANNSDLILFAILNKQSIPDAFLGRDVFGFHSNMDAYYKYAATEYTLQLPTGATGGLSSILDSVLIPVIEEDLGFSILLYDSIIAPMTGTLAMLPYLTDVRGFDLNTNQIMTPMAGSLPVGGRWDEVYLRSIDISEDNTEATMHYMAIQSDAVEPEDLEAYDSFETVPIPVEVVIGDLYCIAWFSNQATPGDRDWWYYNMNSGVYPELAVSYDTISSADSFMPVIPIRYKNKDMTDPAHQGTDLYKTSAKLLKKSGIDIQVLAGSLNDNPDIEELDYAYVTHCIDLKDINEHPHSCFYLGMFFHDLHSKARFNELDYIDALQNDKYADFNAYNFYDPRVGSIGSEEARLRISVSYSYILSEVKRGDLGPVGFAISEITHKPSPISWNVWDAQEPEDDWFIIFKCQISDTTYREVTVANLEHRNNIHHSHAVVTPLGALLLDGEEANHNFLIPLHYGLCASLPKPMRDIVFRRSFRIIINGYVSTAIPWYSQGWFMMVKLIVAVVLAAWSGGSSIGVMLSEMAAEGVLYALLYTVLYIAVSAAISAAFKLVAQMLGPKYAGILAIVVLVVSIVLIQSGGGFAAFNAGTNTNMISAQMFLSISGSLFKASASVSQDMIADIQDDMEDFQKQSELEQKELDDTIEQLLTTHFVLDPMEMISPMHFTGFAHEPPDGFYNRTIHHGNIGTLVLNVVESYHDTLLTLPDPQYNDRQFS